MELLQIIYYKYQDQDIYMVNLLYFVNISKYIAYLKKYPEVVLFGS